MLVMYMTGKHEHLIIALVFIIGLGLVSIKDAMIVTRIVIVCCTSMVITMMMIPIKVTVVGMTTDVSLVQF